MAEERNIRIEDDKGNIYYPHTKAITTFLSNGKDAEKQFADIDTKIKEIDIKASNIKVPVASVNGKIGAVTLVASDVGAETPGNASAKANAAESNAKTYTDGKIKTVESHLAEIVHHDDINTTYYVNSTNGNDNNNGLSEMNPFKTIEKALSLIPIIKEKDYTINIIGHYICDKVIEINNKKGHGLLNIKSHTSKYDDVSINKCLKINNCENINILNISLIDGVEINNSIRIKCIGSKISKTGYAAFSSWNSSCLATLCIFENTKFGIYAVQNSLVYSYANTGNATDYGLSAEDNSIIGKRSSQPTGTIANEIVSGGGVIR